MVEPHRWSTGRVEIHPRRGLQRRLAGELAHPLDRQLPTASEKQYRHPANPPHPVSSLLRANRLLRVSQLEARHKERTVVLVARTEVPAVQEHPRFPKSDDWRAPADHNTRASRVQPGVEPMIERARPAAGPV